MQEHRLSAGGVADVCESSASGERNGCRACENPGCVVEKHFVDDARGKRSPVDHRATFNHQARDLHLAKVAEDSSHVWMAIRSGRGQLLHAYAELQQLLFLLLFGK